MEKETGPLPDEDLSLASGQQDLQETVISAFTTLRNPERQRGMLPAEASLRPVRTFQVVIGHRVSSN